MRSQRFRFFFREAFAIFRSRFAFFEARKIPLRVIQSREWLVNGVDVKWRDVPLNVSANSVGNV